MRTGRAWMVLGALALCALAPRIAAGADLLRCQGPDGRVLYTDDKSACPASKPYRPDAEVHEVSTPASVDPAAGDARRAHAQERERKEQAESAQAAVWRQRKTEKEDELRQVTSEYESLKTYVSFCNRGNYVFTDDESGLKTQVTCHDLSARLAALDVRVQSLRDYLDRGLPDECRRAGCLPGWLR